MSRRSASDSSDHLPPPGPSRDRLLRLLKISESNDKLDSLPNVYAQTSSTVKIDRIHVIRLLAFIVLEGAFIALAVGSHGGIPLGPAKLDEQIALVKGFFTILFIVWQIAALSTARDIITVTFSAEWFHLVSDSGQFILDPRRRSDRVSILTANVYDRSVHFISQSASRSFRVAYISALLFFAIPSLAPGSMRVDNRIVPSYSSLSIGNLTITSDDNPSSRVAIQRAWEITHLDQVEFSRYGFDMQSNWLMAWPNIPTRNGNGTYKYPSDVVRYGHDCHWSVPSLDNQTGIWTADSARWSVWNGNPYSFAGPFMSSGIFPLIRTNVTDNTALSAFLFLGTNSSLSSGKNLPMDLSGITETTYSAAKFSSNSTGAAPSDYTSDLATILICDAHIELSGGEVTQTSNTTLQVSRSGGPLQGNVPFEAARHIFTRSLLAITSNVEPDSDGSAVNFLASKLFLNIYNHDSENRKPMELKNINSQMNAFVSLAAKAYMDGYLTTQSIAATALHSLVTVDSYHFLPDRTLALYSNTLFLTVSSALIAASTALLIVLVFFPQRNEPFTLSSIMTSQMQSTSSASLQQPSDGADVPLNAFDNESNEKDLPDLPNTPSLGVRQRPPPVHDIPRTPYSFPVTSLQARTAVFALIEVGYIALCSFCMVKGGVPLFESEYWSRGAFTVIVILWQNIAVFFAQQVISTTFSSEWHLRFTKTRKLVPGETDSVSTLGSGLINQGWHFLSSTSSRPFKLGFITSLLFLVLSGSAPGSIQMVRRRLDSTKTTDIAIGNLTMFHEGTDSQAPEVRFPLQRARLISRLEQDDNTQFGYSMSTSYLFGLPPIDYNIGDSDIFRYPSDVYQLAYFCNWEAPTFIDHNGTAEFRTSQNAWTLALPPGPGSSPATNLTAGLWPLRNLWIEQTSEGFPSYNSSLSSFILLGGANSANYSMNLTSIPTSNSSTWNLPQISSGPVPPAVSILVCNPSSVVSGGSIELDSTRRTLEVVSLGKRQTSYNNLPDNTVNWILSRAVPDIVNYSDMSSSNGIYISDIAARLFLDTNSSDFKPLDSKTIANNVQHIVSSASKAFLDGYYVTDNGASLTDPSGKFFNTPVEANRTSVEKISIVTNKPFLGITICFTVFISIMMVTLLDSEVLGETFCLENVLRELTWESEDHSGLGGP